MRKFIFALLAAICLSCLAAAVACGGTKYYKLEFVTGDGVEIECAVSSGAQVKSGYEVVFKLVIDDKALGEPEVKGNDKELTPDSDGNYKMKITSDTSIVVSGVYMPGSYDVTFQRNNDDFIDFLDLDGNSLDVVNATSEEEIKFKVHISVYYEGKDYGVYAGSTLLTPDEDGVYTYTVTGKTEITINGLVIEHTDTFALRDGTGDGDGTAENPFRIRKAIDLYEMSDLISSSWISDGRYAVAHYRLENDIDLKGERLFIIGDTTIPNSVFAGEFDGNGHTISNYYITDTLVEQATFTTIHLQPVGFFGYASSAYIHDLNLEGFTITANGSTFNDAVYVGGLVGYGNATTVTNCSVSGTIIADGGALIGPDGSLSFSFVGGIMGVQQSYNDEEMRSYAVIQSCSSDVDITVESGFVYGAGGITGFLISQEERTSSAILNCYTTGEVVGAARAGGIVGILGSYGSVKNCYATGILEARSNESIMDGYELFSYAYAGGIVGYARFNSIISDSFFTGELYAFASNQNFAATDGILGVRDEDETDYIYAEATVCYNNSSTSNTRYGTKVNSINDDYIKNTLGWSAVDWSFKSNGRPEINRTEQSKRFTITINVDGNTYHEITVSSDDELYPSIYVPMSFWYLAYSGELPEFVANGSYRTYGYFFDADLTVKVPFGYIPTDDITLYAEYVDYAEVMGDYFIKDSTAYLTLNEDGYLIYRNGAISSVSTYVYDGDIVWLFNTFIAIASGNSDEFYSFKAVVEDGVMSIYDLTLYPQTRPLTAARRLENFSYGTYFDTADNTIVFNPDGTGALSLSGTNTNFTYTVSGTALTASVGGVNYTGVVGANGVVAQFNGLALTLGDAFLGTWEGAFGTNTRYTFDGKGKYTYVEYAYDSDGSETVVSSTDGVYEVISGELVMGSVKATLNYDEINEGGEIYKLLSLDVDGVTYYRENSFVGTWVYTSGSESIEITFMGINDEGYGVATVSYGSDGSVTVNYSVTKSNGGRIYVPIYMYYNEYGLLEFDPVTLTLKGGIYSVYNEAINTNAVFCCYDEIKGVWNSTNPYTFAKLSFNGLSQYDIKATATNAPVSGKVVVYATVTSTRGTSVDYTYSNGKGSFTYNGKTYNFEYDEQRGTITVETDGESFTLTEVV